MSASSLDIGQQIRAIELKFRNAELAVAQEDDRTVCGDKSFGLCEQSSVRLLREMAFGGADPPASTGAMPASGKGR
jgi:hypothetical protein